MDKNYIIQKIISWEETIIRDYLTNKYSEVIKMIGIYKITNKINQDAYIGQSTQIEERFKEHKKSYNWEREENKKLYQAFKDFGLNNFSFEVLEECSIEELNNKEQYYINLYKTYPNQYNMTPGGQFNSGECHPSHKLTEKDIIDIRTRYNNKERKQDVYFLYNTRIGESGFSKIWKGETWKTIMPEVYTKENKDFHLHNTSNSGSKNGRSKLTEEDVRILRTRKKNGESLSEVYKDYQDKLTYKSFENVWSYRNWKNIIV